MDKYAFTIGLANTCEYAYRKGVADAASSGDYALAMEIADRDDNHQTFRLMRDDFGQVLTYLHYKDHVISFAGRVSASEFRAFMIYKSGAEPMKKSICQLVDCIYRQGLVAGCSMTKEKGLDFFHSVGTRMNHNRPGKIKQSKIDWIEEIKYTANRLYNLHRFNNSKTHMNELSIIIGEAVLESRTGIKYQQEELETKKKLNEDRPPSRRSKI